LQAHCQSPTSQTQTKALSKSLQSQPKRKRNFKKYPTARQKTMKETATNRPTNHGRQGSTGGNITYTQAGVSCFVGQISAKFKVQFFVGSSVVKIPACV
jgi:hypothetical protein